MTASCLSNRLVFDQFNGSHHRDGSVPDFLERWLRRKPMVTIWKGVKLGWKENKSCWLLSERLGKRPESAPVRRWILDLAVPGSRRTSHLAPSPSHQWCQWSDLNVEYFLVAWSRFFFTRVWLSAQNPRQLASLRNIATMKSSLLSLILMQCWLVSRFNFDWPVYVERDKANQ